jgi:hypothetical protein
MRSNAAAAKALAVLEAPPMPERLAAIAAVNLDAAADAAGAIGTLQKTPNQVRARFVRRGPAEA